MSQCEEGVKVLSRIIFYLLLEKLVSRLRTPRSRTAARWKKLLTGNYVIIQVYFTSHNISTYISERARGWKNANRGHRLRARARARNRVFLVEKCVRFISLRYSSKRIFRKWLRHGLSNLFAKTNYLSRELVRVGIYTR